MGNLFIADEINNRVFILNRNLFFTLAGGGEQQFESNSAQEPLRVQLRTPQGLALDADGSILIADTGNNRIRKFEATTGLISTIAGNGKLDISPDGAPANSPIIPTDLATLSNRILFSELHRVRFLDNNVIRTLSGQLSSGFAGDGDLATKALLNSPGNIVADRSGNLYIADNGNHCIRRIEASTGRISTYAGTGRPGFSGEGGPATRADLAGPFGVALDRQGNLYIADRRNNRVRRVDATTQIITTIAGNGLATSSGDGGDPKAASLNSPSAVHIDNDGNIYIGEVGAIRRISAATKNISTIVGTGIMGYSGDGDFATSASISEPYKILLDSRGNLLFTDTLNHSIRIVRNIAALPENSFSLSVDKTSQTATPGSTVTFTFTTRSIGNFFEPISFSAHSVPNLDLGIAFQPQSVTVGASTTLAVAVPLLLQPPQSFEIIVSARAGRITRKKVLKLTIDAANNADFNIRVSPTTANLKAGESAIFTVSVTSDAQQPVTLTASNIPNLKVTFDPQSITPQASARMTVTADQRTTSGQVSLTVAGTRNQLVQIATVTLNIEGNLPPVFTPIENQRVAIGQVLTVDVQANDPNGNSGLRLLLLSAPSYVTLQDLGSGRGLLRIAPQVGDKDGSVTLQAIDPGGLTAQISFNIAIRSGPTITTVTYSKPNLTINGTGFGITGAKVSINGVDTSPRIQSQNDTTIILNGNKKKLNIKKGTNTVTVTTQDGLSATATF
ncbi:MAG: hypothetical protein RMM17_02900 [Acidobacteriota bacterium]|nr:hypothetical protein [Blastocatellia bacterium]MDW8411616.1 hypothetical protein [Acidobacteriota bacterium]